MSLKDFYERKYRRGEENLYPLKIEAIKLLPPPPKKVLDVGCGSGIISEILGKKGYSVIGIDISSEAVKKAKNRGIEAYEQDLMEPLIFDDNYFDAIWISEVIEHLIDPAFALKELNRVLLPSKILLLTTPNSAFLWRRLLHLTGKTCTQIQNYSHLRFFNKSLLFSLLVRSGFNIKKVYGFTRFPFARSRGILIKYWVNLLGNNFIVITFKTDRRE